LNTPEPSGLANKDPNWEHEKKEPQEAERRRKVEEQRRKVEEQRRKVEEQRRKVEEQRRKVEEQQSQVKHEDDCALDEPEIDGLFEDNGEEGQQIQEESQTDGALDGAGIDSLFEGDDDKRDLSEATAKNNLSPSELPTTPMRLMYLAETVEATCAFLTRPTMSCSKAVKYTLPSVSQRNKETPKGKKNKHQQGAHETKNK
jgi:hypothetical protein